MRPTSIRRTAGHVILAVALGLLIGLTLGALGGGGSILAVPVLAHVAGQSAGAATATSLVAVGASAAVGAVGHARKGNVRWTAGAVFIATGVAGSWLGTRVNAGIDDRVLLLAFSGLVLVAAWRMLTACPSCTRTGEEEAIEASGGAADAPPPSTAAALGRAALPIALAGSAVGFLTGLFGVGGGFVIVPALTLALGLAMPAAIGTSLLVVVGNAAVALAFRGLGAVEWDVALPFTATMLVGTAAGSLVAHRLPPERSLQAFSALLVLVAVGNGVAAWVGRPRRRVPWPAGSCRWGSMPGCERWCSGSAGRRSPSTAR